MSQEAEYILRNISRGQVRDIARRIAEQHRSDSERHMRQWWQTQASRLEGRLHGELVGLRDEMLRRHASIASQVECNRRLAEALREQGDLQGQDLIAQRAAIGVLEEHDRELRAQLTELDREQIRLNDRLTATETMLKTDIAERQAERSRNANHARGLRGLVTDNIGRMDGRRVMGVGLATDLDAVHASALRADQIAANPAQEMAAIALYSDALNQIDRLQLELHRRETEISRRREAARLALAGAAERLADFAGAPEAAEVFSRVIPALQKDIRDGMNRQGALRDAGVADFGRRLAEWDQAATDANALAERVETLWRERDHVLDQIRNRNRVLAAVFESLIEVWGTRFEVETMYAVTDDPRSTLMLQSQRPHGKNVTIHLELDGRMQVSFTGYVGMQCAKDVEEFRRHLGQSGDLQVQHLGSTDRPDEPNPPGVDGGPASPPVYRRPEQMKKDERQEKR